MIADCFSRCRFTLLLVVIMSTIGGSGVAWSEDFKSVEFGLLSKPLRLSSDDRMTPRDAGSIEVMLELDDKDVADQPERMTIFAFEDIQRTRFRLDIVNKGRELELANAAGVVRLPFDLTNFGVYQIGISTFGAQSRIFVDGVLVGEVDIGYGPVVRLPMLIGGGAAGKTPLQGKVAYLRVWDRPLVAADYRRTNNEFELPTDLPDLLPSVKLYSRFTDQAVGAYYQDALTLDDVSADGSVAGLPKGSMFIDVLPENSRLKQIIGTGSDRLHTIKFVTVDPFGNTTSLPLRGRTPTEGRYELQSFTLNDDEEITGINVVASTDWITDEPSPMVVTKTRVETVRYIEFLTSQGRTSPRFGQSKDDPTRPTGGGPLWSVRFPAGNTVDAKGRSVPAFDLDAIIGFADENGVHGLSLAPKAFPPVVDPDGLWEPKSQNDAPVKRTDEGVVNAGGRAPHGNYEDRSVLRLRLLHRGRTIRLMAEQFFFDMRLQPDGDYALGTSRLRFNSANELVLAGTPYKKVRPRDDLRSSQDFLKQGAPFAQDFQVPDIDYSYHGYHLSRVDPRALNDTRAQANLVFRRPAATSVDYYAMYNKIVPSGLLVNLDKHDRTLKSTVTIGSGQEWAEAHASSLGMDIGVPKVVSFGVTNKVSREAEGNNAEGKQLVLSEEYDTKYGLVADFRYMTLDQDFYQTMLSVMQRRARGEAVDYRTEVIDVYGTHFPYAVTSGSVARNQLEYTKEMAAELAKSGSSVDVHASATIRGVEGGGKFSKDDSLSDKFNSSLELQVEKFDKVGDATIPVPVFMDLRPLDRLLDVAFFGNAIDPKVGLQPLGLVARELRAAIEAYLQAQAPKYDKPEDIWEIYAYSMNFDRLEFDLTVKDLSDLDAVAGQVAFDPLFRGRTPMEIRKWSVSDPIVLVGDNPFQKLPKAMSIDLPDTGQYRIVTAQEYCSQKPLLTAFAWGVRMNRVFRGLGGNSLTDDKAEQERFTYLKDLGTADTQEADNFVIAPRIQGRLTVSARRIPGNQGQLRPLPDCH